MCSTNQCRYEVPSEGCGLIVESGETYPDDAYCAPRVLFSQEGTERTAFEVIAGYLERCVGFDLSLEVLCGDSGLWLALIRKVGGAIHFVQRGKTIEEAVELLAKELRERREGNYG